MLIEGIDSYWPNLPVHLAKDIRMFRQVINYNDFDPTGPFIADEIKIYPYVTTTSGKDNEEVNRN